MPRWNDMSSRAFDGYAASEQYVMRSNRHSRNVRIDYRSGGGDADRTRRYAAKLVARAPVVSLAAGGAVLAPLLQATCTVPVVFAQSPSRQGAYAESSLPAA